MGRATLRNVLRAATLVAGITFCTVSPLWAAPISVSALLTGDPRAENPDYLKVLVTVTGDTNSNKTNWQIDLDMSSWVHPWGQLDEFGFNLAGSKSDYSFSDFNLPYASQSNTIVEGYGGSNANFLLKLDSTGSDASNAYSLSFTLTKKTGSFNLNDFAMAPTDCGATGLGCNQLAAHLESLGWFGMGDGIASGNFSVSSTSQANPVPEPGTMLLLGSGAVASFLARRRKAMAQNSVA